MTRPKSHRPLPSPLLSMGELADYWGCSTDTVAEMVAHGDLPAVRIGPRMVRVRLSDADAVLRPVAVNELAVERVS